MKKKILLFLSLFIVSLAIISCNVSYVKHTYILNETYKSLNLSDRNIILVFPADDQIVIDNKDDVLDDFGGVNAKPEARIRKFYFPEFFSAFQSFVSSDSLFLIDGFIDGIVAIDTFAKKEIDLKTGTDSSAKPYFIPEKSVVQSIGLENAVFVVIDEINFKRNNFKMEYYWDDKTRKQANLEVGLKIIVWDYKADAPVFYGTLTERTEFHFNMQRKQWNESARDLAKKTVKTVRCL